MFHRLRSYLKFLWHSKNEHGVHSPFIFSFVTKCLYDNKIFSVDKVENIVLKSMAYFQCQSASVVPKDHRLSSKLKNLLPQISLVENSPDFIFITECNDDLVKDHLLNNEHIENHSVVILKDIHKSRENTQLWKNIKASDKVRLTVDLYYCAVIFFRKEQVEEHFKIRI